MTAPRFELASQHQKVSRLRTEPPGRPALFLRILGAWCKSPNKRILSYKDALQRTKYESTETTVCTWSLLCSGALLCIIGDHRLPKWVEYGELENAGKRGPGVRKNNGRTAWQRIASHLASRGTGAPLHRTLGVGSAPYAKVAAAVWWRGYR